MTIRIIRPPGGEEFVLLIALVKPNYRMGWSGCEGREESASKRKFSNPRSGSRQCVPGSEGAGACCACAGVQACPGVHGHRDQDECQAFPAD